MKRNNWLSLIGAVGAVAGGLVAAGIILSANAIAAESALQDSQALKANCQKISAAFRNSSAAYDRMAELCDRFGPRPAGSTNLEAAIDWIVEQARADGLSVRTEPVAFQAWKRGAESAEMILPRAAKLHLIGLGGTISTPPEGITGEVVVVSNLDQISKLSGAKGKIVLVNQPFKSYGETVTIRSRGAIESAKIGAVACLIRSVASYSMQTPHTGRMRYDTTVPRIPAAALSVEDSEMMARMQARGQKIVAHLMLQSEEVPAASRNVIAEISGREKPEEIVVVGGHVDSWDVGQGAMDNGGGCAVTWEALRVIQKLGIKPRRTIRLVLWTNEENGIDGARAYGRLHAAELPKHIAALESDQGVFQPTGLNFSGSRESREMLQKFTELLTPAGAAKILGQSDDTDLIPLREAGVPTFDLVTDNTRYFWFHHSDADTVDKLNPADMSACGELVATLAYTLADAKEPLRATTPAQ
jgi:carboxypeptidase Q